MTNPRIDGVECPSRLSRELLTDEEFWPYVLQGILPYAEPDEPDIDDRDNTSNQDTACTECGEHGACATDSEGRALIHIQTNGDDE